MYYYAISVVAAATATTTTTTTQVLTVHTFILYFITLSLITFKSIV